MRKRYLHPAYISPMMPLPNGSWALIPQPLRGRWGYFNRVVEYLLNIGWELLRQIWPHALLEKATARAAAAGKLLLKDEGELSIDLGENEDAYVVKESKFIRAAFKTILDDNYWMYLRSRSADLVIWWIWLIWFN